VPGSPARYEEKANTRKYVLSFKEIEYLEHGSSEEYYDCLSSMEERL
jgi:hypothetical protein